MTEVQPMRVQTRRSKLRLGNESDEDSADNAPDEDDVLGLREPDPPAPRRAPAKRKQPAVWEAPPVEPRPHYVTPYDQLDHRHVVREMKKTILFQDEALVELSRMLMMAHAGDFFQAPNGSYSLRQNIHARILSGPSGVGKTETVLLIRRLLGMLDGEPNAAQYIHIDGSVYNDVTQINRLCGSGPGYAGSEQRTSLVDDLRRAIETPELRALAEISRRNKDYAKHCAHYQKMKDEGRLQYPRVILLFIDEIDKAHVNFMTVLNGLLDSGQMKSSRSDPFVLPRATQLIVLFTSNFGDKKIEAMPTRDPFQAQRYVEEAMRAHGLPSNSIERFGHHVIFFPISEANLSIVVQKKVDEMMQSNTRLTEKYGSVDYKQAVQCIIDFVKQVSNAERGVRNTMKNLNLCLQPLLIESFYALERMSSEQLASACEQLNLGEKTLQLFMETLHVGMFDEGASLDMQLDTSGLNARALIQCVLGNEYNQSALERYRSDGQVQSIHAFGVSQGDRLVNCLLMPLIVQNYTINQYDTQASADTIDELKRGYRALKGDYCELKDDYRSLIDGISEVRETGGGDDALARLVHDACEKEREKEFMQFSDDSEDEAPEQRKRPALGGVDEARTSKKLRLVEGEDPRVVELVEECLQQAGMLPPPGGGVAPALAAADDESTTTEETEPSDEGDMVVERGGGDDADQPVEYRLCAECDEEKPLVEFTRMKHGRRRKDGSFGIQWVSMTTCARCYNKRVYMKRKCKDDGDDVD